MHTRWGTRYPISGVHECMYGQIQAIQITQLARKYGVDAVVVHSEDNGQTWKED